MNLRLQSLYSARCLKIICEFLLDVKPRTRALLASMNLFCNSDSSHPTVAYNMHTWLSCTLSKISSRQFGPRRGRCRSKIRPTETKETRPMPPSSGKKWQPFRNRNATQRYTSRTRRYSKHSERELYKTIITDSHNEQTAVIQQILILNSPTR